MIFEARVAEMPRHWAGIYYVTSGGKILLNTNLINGVFAFYVDQMRPLFIVG